MRFFSGFDKPQAPTVKNDLVNSLRIDSEAVA
jgi:hypothetical protein